MSDEAPVVDKRTVVRVGLPNRSAVISAAIKNSQPLSVSTSDQTFQFIKMPIGDPDIGSHGEDDESDNVRRRDLMARHPSYRKLYNELASNPSAVAYKLEEDSSDGQMTQDSNDATGDDLSTGHGGNPSSRTYQIVSHDNAVSGDDNNLQSITLKNLSGGGMSSGGGATIVQYTQGPDGQLFIPVHQLNASGLVFPPGLMVSTSGAGSPPMGLEETCKKRELRLLKNKEAAKECRRKKKEYVKCLENRVAVLENQNKTLIEELKSLKELYCQKDIHS